MKIVLSWCSALVVDERVFVMYVKRSAWGSVVAGLVLRKPAAPGVRRAPRGTRRERLQQAVNIDERSGEYSALANASSWFDEGRMMDLSLQCSPLCVETCSVKVLAHHGAVENNVVKIDLPAIKVKR